VAAGTPLSAAATPGVVAPAVSAGTLASGRVAIAHAGPETLSGGRWSLISAPGLGCVSRGSGYNDVKARKQKTGRQQGSTTNVRTNRGTPRSDDATAATASNERLLCFGTKQLKLAAPQT
jgi:hypothetical protein